jgi:hypothetical protein
MLLNVTSEFVAEDVTPKAESYKQQFSQIFRSSSLTPPKLWKKMSPPEIFVPFWGWGKNEQILERWNIFRFTKGKVIQIIKERQKEDHLWNRREAPEPKEKQDLKRAESVNWMERLCSSALRLACAKAERIQAWNGIDRQWPTLNRRIAFTLY